MKTRRVSGQLLRAHFARRALVLGALVLIGLALYPGAADARPIVCGRTRGLRLGLVTPGSPLPLGSGAPLVQAVMASADGRQPPWATQLRAIRVRPAGRPTSTRLGPGLYRLTIPGAAPGQTYTFSGLLRGGDVTFGPAGPALAAPQLEQVASYRSRRSHGEMIAIHLRFAQPAPPHTFAALVYQGDGPEAHTWVPIAPGERTVTMRGVQATCTAMPPHTITYVRRRRSASVAWLTSTGVLSPRSAAVRVGAGVPSRGR